MSASRPSAFDVLMANASKKKKNPAKPQESSPKKRKAPIESQTPNSPLTDNAVEKQADESGSNRIEDGKSNEIESGLSNGDSDKGPVAAKKPKNAISPDESLLELKKKAVEFNVKRAVYWGQGERVPFMFVVKAFDAISKESGRIAITEIVCNMLRTVMETTPDDLLAVVYLLANRIASAHEGLELGIGDASIIKALAEACGTKEAHIKKQYKVIEWFTFEFTNDYLINVPQIAIYVHL